MRFGTKEEWADAGKAWGKALLGAALGLITGLVLFMAYDYFTHLMSPYTTQVTDSKNN